MPKFLFIYILALLPAIAFSALGPSVDTTFTSNADGTTQRYVLRLPSDFNAMQSHDLLIALHGHGSDRWQFATDTRNECKAARDFADSRKMIYVCPDYRATTSWMGPLAEKDVVQIIQYFKANYLINRVSICGASMGGSSALTFLVLHPDMVDGVAAMNPTANHLEYEGFQDYISASFGGTKKQIPSEYKKRSAEYWPERINVPVGITTGGLDTTVPPASALRLADILTKLGKKVKSLNRSSTGHSTSYADANEILRFAADTVVEVNICTNVAVKQLYSSAIGPLVYKHPGIPGAPSSGNVGTDAFIIGTTLYDRGASICSTGAFRVYLTRPADIFASDIGLYSGRCANGDVTIKICQSGNEQNVLWQSPLILTGQQAIPVSINIAGLTAFDIIVDWYDGNITCDSVIFGNARVLFPEGTVYLDEAQGDSSCEMDMDFDGNCRIDLNDMAIFASDWLRCGYKFESMCDD